MPDAASEHDSDSDIEVVDEAEATGQKRKGGRPKAFVRNYYKFTTSPGFKTATAGCVHCEFVISSPRADAMLQHMCRCPHAPDEVKQRCLNAAARKKQQQQQPAKKSRSGPLDSFVRPSASSSSNRFTAELQRQTDQALLRWTVCSGIAWHATSSPLFRRFVQLLSPTYSPPGKLQSQIPSSLCRCALGRLCITSQIPVSASHRLSTIVWLQGSTNCATASF